MHYENERDMGDYVMYDVVGDDDDWEDDIPEGCAACGGDYPNCVDSCPLFDD